MTRSVDTVIIIADSNRSDLNPCLHLSPGVGVCAPLAPCITGITIGCTGCSTSCAIQALITGTDRWLSPIFSSLRAAITSCFMLTCPFSVRALPFWASFLSSLQLYSYSSGYDCGNNGVLVIEGVENTPWNWEFKLTFKLT